MTARNFAGKIGFELRPALRGLLPGGEPFGRDLLFGSLQSAVDDGQAFFEHPSIRDRLDQFCVPLREALGGLRQTRLVLSLPIGKLLKILLGLGAAIITFWLVAILTIEITEMMTQGIGSMMSNRGFWATFFTNASTTDLWGSVLKTTLFGAIIAIVCCYKGMTASGGAEGVGRAVNQAVVIAFLGVFAFNYVFTQTLLATHPEITVIR